MEQANEFRSFWFIDDEGVLDVARVEDFVKEVELAKYGRSYAIVSIMGPQSSGKSTLLNQLFGTNFKEMNALEDRCQTTKGIWLGKCPGTETCTLVMDLEGTDGRERGEDDTAFEKQTALFALALSDIVLVNMWCHDVGRVQAANKPLLRIVFQIVTQLFHDRKTTLLFVLRDKTRTPMEKLEALLLKDIQQIWDSFAKSDAGKEIPLSDFFNIKIVGLSSYEEKLEQFKEQVDNLREEIFNSITLGGIIEDGRNVVPASDFSFSAQEIWKTIKGNKDLNLPAHKVMVATVRCEEIANKQFASFIANEDWCQLEQDVNSHPVPDFKEKLSMLLDTCLSEYDMEVKFFDEGVKTEKRRQLKDKLLQLFQLAYQSLLEQLSSQTLDKFKEEFQRRLSEGQGFYVAACGANNYVITQFDEECAAAIIEQENWDSSILRHKLQQDIKAHVASLRSSMLSELLNLYEAQLEEILSVPVVTLLLEDYDDTWQKIRDLFHLKIQPPINKFTSKLDAFCLDGETYRKMHEKLVAYARGVVQAKSRHEAGRVLTHMKDRFRKVFSDLNLRRLSEDQDIQTIRKAARCVSLKLLSNMAAIRLDGEADSIENILFLALEGNEAIDISLDQLAIDISLDRLASDTWDQVPLSRTLITPVQCKDFWREFNEYSEAIVVQSEETSKAAELRSYKAGRASGVVSGLVVAAAIGGATVGGAAAGVVAVGAVGAVGAAAAGVTVVEAVAAALGTGGAAGAGIGASAGAAGTAIKSFFSNRR